MFRLFSLCLGAVALAVACSNDLAGNDERGLAPGRSGLALELVDAPTHQAKEINVTIEKVTAHSSTAGWVTVFDQGPVTVDLLTLQTRVMQLGFANLPPGKITQIRLYLTEGGTQNVVLPDDSVAPLKVPSGVQSGIKIHGPFELSACDITTVTLDFDGHKSIWYHPTGNGGEWILRPVIRMKKVQSQSTTCDGTPTGGGSGSTGGGNGSTGGGSGGGNESPDAGGLTEVGGGGSAPGTACTMGSQCLSGVCSAAMICSAGAQGTPCNVGSNCASGVCDADGSCTAPVTPVPLGGTGAACSTGSQCVSGVCASNVCSPGLQGQPCSATATCDIGFSCVAGVCEPDLG